MLKLYTLVAVILIGFYVWTVFQSKFSKTKVYGYKRKEFFMTRAEHELYDTLIQIVGNEYYIFPQVHLSTIVDNKVVGQNWRSAFRHINQKSVDFVLCDKAYISPKLVIELDDRTHQHEDRITRDKEVERILSEAKLPLLRLENSGQFNSQDIIQKINHSLEHI